MDREGYIIQPNDLVTLTKMNHISEIQYMEKRNNSVSIKKLNKHEYVDLNTGEIKEYNHIENRQESYNSLRQTFKKMRYLINNNLEGKSNELHCVLTYAENMTDPKQLYKDTKNLLDKIRRKYGDIDYICIPEPQERGAWHNHLLIRFNNLEKIYIPNKFDEKTKKPIDAPLFDMWGQGWVKINTLKDIDNIGAYLSAYLSDIELTDETDKKVREKGLQEERELVEKEIDGKKKKFIKGGRLHMYPPGMRMIRKSKGMKYPERENMTYKKAKKIVGSDIPHYTKTYNVQTDEFENVITFEQYNIKRD